MSEPSTQTNAIKIGDLWCDPSRMEISIQTVSGEDAGRDQSGYMHMEYVTTKYKIQLEWYYPDLKTVKDILKIIRDATQNRATNSAIPVVFRDPVTNTEKTKYFYVGDRSVPYQMWGQKRKFFSRMAFDLIEL